MKNKFQIGETVEVSSKDSNPPNDFVGMVIGYRNGCVQVKDQENDVFDVDEDQCQKYQKVQKGWLSMSPTNRQLVFISDISIVGHTNSDIPTLPTDVVVKRGMLGHYLSREVSYKAGEAITPQHFHRSGENVLFNTKDFNFRVPMSHVQLHNPETGKTSPIRSKFFADPVEEKVTASGEKS